MPQIQTSTIDRRALLGAAGAALALGATGAVAQDENTHHQGEDHGAPKNVDLVTSALECARTGEDCLAHCFASFAADDTSLAQCAQLARELIAACTALSMLAAHDSKHLAAFAASTRKICSACNDECRKHKHHKQCMTCAEACVACMKHCDAYV